jgi:aryl-alcohol dehydrogenase-like predicted oxidoreductase
METRRLGRSDLELSVIGLGTWAFGGRCGGAEYAASLATAHAAIDAGVNWIDTADVYGQGRAERLLGQVLRDRPGEVLVATKGGIAWEITDGQLRIWRDASGAHLRTAVERSLQHLGVERIDLWQLHWPDQHIDPQGDPSTRSPSCRTKG